MSYPEVLLWQRLRSRASGLHFRNHHAIGPYVVDFYFSPKRLAIEIDGQIHSTPTAIEHDRDRDRFIRGNGFRLVRINAAEVLKDADAVAASIVSLAAAPLHHAAHGPPPRSGEDLGAPSLAASSPRAGEDQE